MRIKTDEIALTSMVVIVAILSFFIVIPESEASESGVAKIGSTYYQSLEEAITSAGDEDTIELLSDVEVRLSITDKVTIEGNNHTITMIGGVFNNITGNGQLTLSNATLAPSSNAGAIQIGEHGENLKSDFHNVVFNVFVFIYGVSYANFDNCIIDGMQIQSVDNVTAYITDSTINEITLNPQVNDQTIVIGEDLILDNTTIDTLLLINNIVIQDIVDVRSITNFPGYTSTVTVDSGTLRYDTLDDSQIEIVLTSGSVVDKTSKTSILALDSEGRSETEIDGNTITIESSASDGIINVELNQIPGTPAVSNTLGIYDIKISATNSTGDLIDYSATITLKIDNDEENPVIVNSYGISWNFIESHTVISYDAESVTFITTHDTYFVVETNNTPAVDEGDEDYPFFPWNGNNQGSPTTTSDDSPDNTKLVVAAAAIVVIMLAAVALMVNRNH